MLVTLDTASTSASAQEKRRNRELPVEARDGGIYLPEAELWLDPSRAKPLAFVSHAHADHFARHGRVLCSSTTGDVLRARFGTRTACDPMAFGESLDLNGHRIELFPAGHTLGSAQIRIERLSDGASLIYTGDYKRRSSLTCEPYEARTADTLVMETTFGLPKYQFPPTEEIRAALVQFCHDAVEDGDVPVLFGYSFGKAQELLATLNGSGFETMAHDSIRKLLNVFESHGYTFPPCDAFDPGNVSGRVLVFPPAAARSVAIRKIKNRRTAVATGWAVHPGAKFRFQVDEAFALSDHADWPDLLKTVEEVQPARVLTTHGYSSEFAAELRRRGFNAWSLEGSDQMELPIAVEVPNLARPCPATRKTDGNPTNVMPDSFRAFAATSDAIEEAPGRLRKVALLAEHLSALDGDDDIACATRYFSGRAAETRESQGQMQVGWAVVRMALLQLTGMSPQRYRQVSQSQNDTGRTAMLLLEEEAAKLTPKPVTLGQIREFLDRLSNARGPATKAALLNAMFASLTPSEGRFLASILTGDLRIGLKDGLIEDAIASAFDAPAADVREAHMLTGDLGATAVSARHGSLQDAAMLPFQPIKPMLASPEETADALRDRLSGEQAGASIWLEDKFDGIRAQLHRTRDRCEIYSRDLRSLSAEFPDLVSAAEAFDAEVVLDGEIVAWAEDGSMGFFDLQKRLGRREPDLFLEEDVPVRFVAFDLLWRDGDSLLKLPLKERRQQLEAIGLPPQFSLVEIAHTRSTSEVEELFNAARRRGNEGLIGKDPASVYRAGRRGKSWLKLKKAAATLDVVVVRAEQGHGKRSHVLSDYTFAVRDEAGGELRIIGKAYSGLTDLEIEELTDHFKAHTIEKKRRVHFVEPGYRPGDCL